MLRLPVQFFDSGCYQVSARQRRLDFAGIAVTTPTSDFNSYLTAFIATSQATIGVLGHTVVFWMERKTFYFASRVVT